MRPSPERTAQVATPTIPPATTPCAFDRQARCNSDEETAEVIAGFAAALDEANRRLEWLNSFFAKLPD